MLRLLAKLLPLIVHEVADYLIEKIKSKKQKNEVS
jgi:hypothetical protein